MALPTTDTLVTYPDGAITSTSFDVKAAYSKLRGVRE